MTVRPLHTSDIPILRAWAGRFEYPEPNSLDIEALLVVADEDDRPIVAVAAKRMVEIFGWMNPEARADLRIQAIALMHESMPAQLKRLGYDCAEVFIPPKLERRGFGRILINRFGWYKNWSSYGRRL